ncbi:binding-protein-dependent transport system inner membrane component [Clostridium sp. CAG:1013]|jgi:oligopeptide transport system permease protein|nr:binding-protein-dependent transport system inner membrane component [Clostridium sp. CAG:1013]
MEKIDKSRFAWVGADPEKRESMARPSVTYWKDAMNRLKKNKVAMVCLGIIILIILSCIVVPWLVPFESREQHLSESSRGFFTACTDSRYEGQNLVHIFGTDKLGRDLLVRTFEGGRVSLMIAFAAVLVNLIIGMIYGGISGYFGGTVDNVMMRIVEVVNGIPYLIVVVLLMMVLEPGIFTMVVAYATVGWTGMARLVRGQCLSLKNQEFVVAAEAMGAKASRIIGKHLLPNTLSVIIINVTLAVPSAIFTEAFLSYIGMGVPVPQPSWGMLAQEGASVFQLYPHQLWIPAIAISLTMLSFNLLGDGLRDAFDPRLRR